MKKYHHGLGKNGTVGDSIVRGYSILSKQFSIIEQQITIHIYKLEAGGWIGQFQFQFQFFYGATFPNFLVTANNNNRSRAAANSSFIFFN